MKRTNQSARQFAQCLITSFLIFFNSLPVNAQEKFPLPKCIYIIQEDGERKTLSYPSSLFYEQVKNEIYVIDSGNSRILIYTSDFFPLFTLNKDDGILSPTCMTLDPEGYLFVGQSTSYNHPRARISIFNPCLKWKKDIHFEGFEGAEKFVPKNIALDKEGKIYVAGTNHVGIIILDKQSGFLSSIKPVDEFMGTKTKVTIVDVEIDRNGKIYLLSEERGRVYVYDTRGEFLFKFGEKGGSSGKLSRPRGITVDTLRDAIYIIDYMRHAANVYSATSGEFLFEFGGKGWGKGWFQFPSDICVNREGQVLVADTFNDRIQVFELK